MRPRGAAAREPVAELGCKCSLDHVTGLRRLSFVSVRLTCEYLEGQGLGWACEPLPQCPPRIV